MLMNQIITLYQFDH